MRFSQSKYGLTPEFKDLVTKLLVENPDDRIELADVLDHPWMKGSKVTHDEFVKEYDQIMEEARIKALKDGEEYGIDFEKKYRGKQKLPSDFKATHELNSQSEIVNFKLPNQLYLKGDAF